MDRIQVQERLLAVAREQVADRSVLLDQAACALAFVKENPEMTSAQILISLENMLAQSRSDLDAATNRRKKYDDENIQAEKIQKELNTTQANEKQLQKQIDALMGRRQLLADSASIGVGGCAWQHNCA